MLRCWLVCATLCLSPLPVQSGSSLLQRQSVSTQIPLGEPAGSKDDAGGMGNASPDSFHTSAAFHQFQLFLQWQQQAEQFSEWVQHRAEFLAWRQQQAGGKRQQGLRQVNVQPEDSHDWPEFKDLFPAVWHICQELAATVRKFLSDMFRNVEAAGEKQVHNVQEVAHNLSSSAQNSLEKNTQDAKQSIQDLPSDVQDAASEQAGDIKEDAKKAAIEGVHDTERSIRHMGFGDFFLLSGFLMVFVLYLTSGFWGLFWYMIWYLNHARQYVWNLLVGHPMPGDTNVFGRIEMEKEGGMFGPTIESKGVAKPPPLMFATLWDELTPGQRYIFKLVGFGSEQWDSAVDACRKSPGLFFCDVIKAPWKSLDTFQQELLMSIGFNRDIWNGYDPENLRIHCKTWSHLSQFEQYVANLLKIHVAQEWDERESPIFHKKLVELEPSQRHLLRQIGFLKQFWVCYRDPMVPSLYSEAESLAETTKMCLATVRNWIMGIWLLIQFIWFMDLLWRLGVLQELWRDFDLYIIIALAVVFLIAFLIRFLAPVANYVEVHFVAEIRTVCAHVKHLWCMVERMASLHKVYQSCEYACMKCHNQGCHACIPLRDRDASSRAGLHAANSSSRMKNSKAPDRSDVTCLPRIRGGTPRSSSTSRPESKGPALPPGAAAPSTTSTPENAIDPKPNESGSSSRQHHGTN